jgi:uncharacterized membrane protein (UPF0127 family)
VNLILDPTAHQRVDLAKCERLEAVFGFEPVCSPITGEWFAYDPWLRETSLISDNLQGPEIKQVVENHTTTEKLKDRCHIVTVSHETLTETAKPHTKSESRAFALTQEDYPIAVVSHALATMDEVFNPDIFSDGDEIVEQLAAQSPFCKAVFLHVAGRDGESKASAKLVEGLGLAYASNTPDIPALRKSREGVVIDITLMSVPQVDTMRADLTTAGYDCLLTVVHSLLGKDTANKVTPSAKRQAQWRDIPRLLRLFGEGNTSITRNHEDFTAKNFTRDVAPRVKLQVLRIISRNIKNIIGVKWFTKRSQRNQLIPMQEGEIFLTHEPFQITEQVVPKGPIKIPSWQWYQVSLMRTGTSQAPLKDANDDTFMMVGVQPMRSNEQEQAFTERELLVSILPLPQNSTSYAYAKTTKADVSDKYARGGNYKKDKDGLVDLEAVEIGVATLRSVLSEIANAFPYAEVLSGDRMTGAKRGKKASYKTARLRDKKRSEEAKAEIWKWGATMPQTMIDELGDRFDKRDLKYLPKSARSKLSEATFQDVSNGTKNRWFPVDPTDVVYVKGERSMGDEFFKLIKKTYASIGGYPDFKTPADLPHDHTIWMGNDTDKDPQADAIRFGRKTHAGFKMTGGATDGGSKAKKAMLRKTARLLRKNGVYAEVSGALAHVLLTKFDVPVVTSQSAVESALGKPVEWLGEHPSGKYKGVSGWYNRKMSVGRKTKIMLGKPKVNESLDEVFDKPFDYSLRKSGQYRYSGFATIGMSDGTEERITLRIDSRGWVAGPLPDQEVWEVQFHIGGQYEKGELGKSDATNPLRVFSTVLAMVDEFIKKEKPDRLMLSAKGSSRVSLYHKMMKRYIGKYALKEKSVGDKHVFLLHKKGIDPLGGPASLENMVHGQRPSDPTTPAVWESLDEAMRRPTGNCYQLASAWVLSSNMGDNSFNAEGAELVDEGGKLPSSAKVVHGYPTLQRAPYKKYGHAWVEVGNTVYDPTHEPILKQPKAIYYQIGNIDESENNYFQYKDIMNQIVKMNHWGPWGKEPKGVYWGSQGCEPDVDVEKTPQELAYEHKNESLDERKTIACGECYPWAFNEFIKSGGRGMTLNHGTIVAPQSLNTKRYGHAWIEKGGRIFDWQMMVMGDGGKFRGKGYPKDIFKELFKPKDVNTYRTTEEALLAVASAEKKHGKTHYGPWESVNESNMNRTFDAMSEAISVLPMHEAFDKAYDWKWNRKGGGEWVASASVPLVGGGSEQLKIFLESGETTDWSIIFTIGNHDSKDDMEFDVESPLRVFSTVVQAVTEFLRKVKPEEINFTASGKSRISLYTQFIKRLVRFGYEVSDTYKWKSGKAWELKRVTKSGVGQLAASDNHQDNITEAFDKPYKWAWEHKASNLWWANATVPTKTKGDVPMVIAARLGLNDIWDLSFNLNKSISKSGANVNAVEPLRVFSTAVSAIKDFIKQESPDEIGFSAEGSSRIKLYDSFSRIITRGDYRLVDKIIEGGRVAWEFEKKSLSESINQTVAINGATFQVDVVSDAAGIQKGLMWRENLENNEGMMFVMPTTDVHSFWMKNTLIPLDLIFINGGRVVGIAANAKPQDETLISSEVPCDRVLEIPAGVSDVHGIEIGDEVIATA